MRRLGSMKGSAGLFAYFFTKKNNVMQLPGLIQFRKCTLTDKDLAEAVAAALCKMYEQPVSVPTRHIPARPDEDFDLLVGEILVRFLEKTELLKEVDNLCNDAAELIKEQNAALSQL